MNIEKKGLIAQKVLDTDYEAGSGSLYIPILGDLFPSLWGQKMREIPSYSFIINGEKHKVDEDFFNSIMQGDSVCMEYDEKGALLSIKPNKMQA